MSSSFHLKYLDTFKKLTEICYLPHFSIIHFSSFKNILYYPNFSETYNILGKWSSNWYLNDKFLVGYIEQDDYSNIYFYIKNCYELKDNELFSMNKKEFILSWKQDYVEDILLNPIIFVDSYVNIVRMDQPKEEKPSLRIKTIDVDSSESSSDDWLNSNSPQNSNFNSLVSSISSQNGLNNSLGCLEAYSKSQLNSQPTTPKTLSHTKENQKEETVKLHVAKTNKPDVYWIYNNEKVYISTCLIPNIKISSYMNKHFSNKAIDETIEMVLKYHEKTKKYIPIID